MTGEVTTLITQRKRSAEFLMFLRWLLYDIYAGYDHLYLFLDNCSIHHTRAVETFIAENHHRLTVIWNATYAPNLNLIERFWGHLKRSAIHNYYFGTVANLENAVMKAVSALNRHKRHTFRLHLKTGQSLPKVA